LLKPEKDRQRKKGKTGKKYGTSKKINQEALAKLLNYDFPGNIRELEKVLNRAFILSEKEEIRPEDIRLRLEEEEEEEEEEEVASRLFREITVKGKSFWDVVYRPFIKRDLKRSEVKEVIRLGLQQIAGSYKDPLTLFNIYGVM